MKIADFGLATIIIPGVPEMLRCGSPGYVAPEILNNLGYGTKADIFSAGIILCIILTGVSPFHGKNYHEVLLKNRSGNVPLTGSHWNFVSEEAKNLVAKMVAKDPEHRCTAMEALEDPWFSLEHTQLKSLSNAQENMKRYQDMNRFNVGKIKPEFSMVTCTPLLNSRFSGKDSPLIVPGVIQGKNGVKKVSDTLVRKREPEEKKEKKSGIIIRDIHDKFRRDRKPNKKETSADDSGNFDEGDIDEEPSGIKEKITAKDSSIFQGNIIGRNVPMTPAIPSKKPVSQLKTTSTPMQNKRDFNPGKKISYLKQLTGAKFTEETKTRHKINPFTSEFPIELIIKEEKYKMTKENTESSEGKNGTTPKFAARGLHKPEDIKG